MDEVKDCPNIVTIYSMKTTPEFFLLFMEYCNGGALSDYKYLGPFPDEVISYILK
jgi:serine/threonine protein kinase